MIFFRFRWVNKNQMALEYTLSCVGFAGTYNNAFDFPHDNPPPPPSPPIPNLNDPRDKSIKSFVRQKTMTAVTSSKPFLGFII